MKYGFEFCCQEHKELEEKDSSSRVFRILCLARHVCSLPTLDDRRGFMDRWKEHHRSQGERDELEKMIRHVWENKQQLPGGL